VGKIQDRYGYYGGFVKNKGMVLGAALLLAGCGNNFEWFPNGGFTNTSTGGSTGATAGKVMKKISFPSGVTWITDLAVDKTNGGFWLLYGTNAAPTGIQKMTAAFTNTSSATGQLTGSRLNAGNWPLTIVEGSSLAFDGTSFWVTSNGSNGGTPVSQIYQIGAGGQLLDTYPCPATSTGFCQGLAWDPATASFWTAGSDNTTLANYQVAGNGTISSQKNYTGLWPTNGVSDVSFDGVNGQVFVVKDGVIPVKGGAVIGKKSFPLPGTGKGDWDGSLLWVVDNPGRVIKGLFVR
jgi:hypothetical protein